MRVVQYVNRRGDTYYLHQGTTKTGKPKWFFSTKREGQLAESIPEGYEVYENHNAQVFLRKIVPRLVTEEEVALVENAVRRLARLRYFFIDVREGSIIVCLPDQRIDFLEGSVSSRFGLRDPDAVFTEMQKFLSYSPMMRFTLVDAKHRRFAGERWCFLGSIDDWFPLAGAGDLSKLVAKYVPHLGPELTSRQPSRSCTVMPSVARWRKEKWAARFRSISRMRACGIGPLPPQNTLRSALSRSARLGQSHSLTMAFNQ